MTLLSYISESQVLSMNLIILGSQIKTNNCLSYIIPSLSAKYDHNKYHMEYILQLAKNIVMYEYTCKSNAILNQIQI